MERDDPFDDIFDEIERLMNEMTQGSVEPADNADFGTDVHVDVHTTEDTVRVVADIPGVEQEDLTLQCDGDNLTIGASTERRQFEERISLPVSVDEQTATASFNNGILEVELERTDSSADISFQ